MTRPSARRILTEAEIELWLRVAETVSRRADAILPERAVRVLPPAAAVAVAPPRKATRAPDTAVPARPALPPLAPFEKRYRQKLTRGRVAIEGAIDLHGLSQAQAHVALLGFLRAAHRDDARLVLVVTGKGRARDAGAEAEPGVLRRLVPIWLRATDMRRLVLGFEEAGPGHGGGGALYVRLRRARADP